MRLRVLPLNCCYQGEVLYHVSPPDEKDIQRNKIASFSFWFELWLLDTIFWMLSNGFKMLVCIKIIGEVIRPLIPGDYDLWIIVWNWLENLHYQQSPKWCSFCWSVYHLFSGKTLVIDVSIFATPERERGNHKKFLTGKLIFVCFVLKVVLVFSYCCQNITAD